MKKMTFAVWFTALLAVFTFSSCLNSDDNDGQRAGAEIVKVVGSLGTYEFQTQNGFTLVPSNMSELTMNLSTRFAMIVYTFNPEQVNQSTKKAPILLKGIMPIESFPVNSSMNGMKDFANAPIHSIVTEPTYNSQSVVFWDEKTMLFPIYYFARNVDEKDMASELKKHSFLVGYDVDNQENNKSTLVLHVRHNVADPELNNERKVNYNTLYDLNLDMVLSDFQLKFGSIPNTIKLEYEGDDTGSYDLDKIKSCIYEINYNKILQQIKK